MIASIRKYTSLTASLFYSVSLIISSGIARLLVHILVEFVRVLYQYLHQCCSVLVNTRDTCFEGPLMPCQHVFVAGLNERTARNVLLDHIDRSRNRPLKKGWYLSTPVSSFFVASIFPLILLEMMFLFLPFCSCSIDMLCIFIDDLSLHACICHMAR